MITYLELLEMIRDGKQPKKIRYGNMIYEFGLNGSYKNEYDVYLSDKIACLWEYKIAKVKCIEIIQEETEIKEIEKTDIVDSSTIDYSNSILGRNFQQINEKFDELIDTVNKLTKEKSNEK